MQDAIVRNDARAEAIPARRRAVFTGLVPYLHGDDLYTALWLWQDKYSDGPAMALHQFINEFACLIEQQVRRSDIHRSLVAAMSKEAVELAPDPYGDMVAYRERRLPEAKLAAAMIPENAAPLPATAILEAVLRSLFLQLDEEYPLVTNKLRRYLSQHLAALGLELAPFSELSQWLSGLREHLNHTYSEVQMRGLLHVAYVGGCEYLGPVQIDTLLARAIDKAEHLPEAKDFAPRQLL
ncbi:MAG TPA: hypothetical protein VKA50_08255 [Gammaproteobacteria bacterium]|nr:hypothetical protein [Gammaproteobacteria bacterium]